MSEVARGGRFTHGLVIGGLSSLLVGLLVFGIAGVALYKRAKREALHGWALRPVVVVAEDVPAGTSVTFDILSQRSLPEQFVTASDVTPEQASAIVGVKTARELHAGDPVRWSDMRPR